MILFNLFIMLRGWEGQHPLQRVYFQQQDVDENEIPLWSSVR